MKTVKHTLSFILIFFMITVQAQVTPIKMEDRLYIEVTGTKEMEVVPDEIYIGIVIRERIEDKVKVTIEEQELKLRESIKSLGIDIANLSLSDANADYLRVRWKTKDVILQKDYTLKVGDAATVGKVYLELEKIEIRDAFISKLSHSKIDGLRKEARIAAIKDAKEKADYLLEAIGEHVGKPLVVVEQTNPINTEYRPISYRADEAYYSADKTYGGSIGKEDVKFNKIKIITSVFVKFEIK